MLVVMILSIGSTMFSQKSIKYKGKVYKVVDASKDCPDGDCQPVTETKVIVNTKSEAELEIEAQKADAATDANAAYRSRTSQENADRDADRSQRTTMFIVDKVLQVGTQVGTTIYQTERLANVLEGGFNSQSGNSARRRNPRRTPSYGCDGYGYDTPDYVDQRRSSRRRGNNGGVPE